MVVFILLVLLVVIFWVIPALRSRGGPASGNSRPPIAPDYMSGVTNDSFPQEGHDHSVHGEHPVDAGGHDNGGSDAGGGHSGH